MQSNAREKYLIRVNLALVQIRETRNLHRNLSTLLLSQKKE